jgi:hypothetical protein
MTQKIGAIGLYLMLMLVTVGFCSTLAGDGVISFTKAQIFNGIAGFVAMIFLQMALDKDV